MKCCHLVVFALAFAMLSCGSTDNSEIAQQEALEGGALHAQQGEGCGDDIDTQCNEDLYCSFGAVTCGTPPVIGSCRAMGTCFNEWDCAQEGNIWAHDHCEGEALCVDGVCQWQCYGGAHEGEACGDDIGVACNEGLYCAFGTVRCGTPPVIGLCRTMGTCDSEWDCGQEDNYWNHDACEGAALCEDYVCAWQCS